MFFHKNSVYFVFAMLAKQLSSFSPRHLRYLSDRLEIRNALRYVRRPKNGRACNCDLHTGFHHRFRIIQGNTSVDLNGERKPFRALDFRKCFDLLQAPTE